MDAKVPTLEDTLRFGRTTEQINKLKSIVANPTSPAMDYAAALSSQDEGSQATDLELRLRWTFQLPPDVSFWTEKGEVSKVEILSGLSQTGVLNMIELHQQKDSGLTPPDFYKERISKESSNYTMLIDAGYMDGQKLQSTFTIQEAESKNVQHYMYLVSNKGRESEWNNANLDGKSRLYHGWLRQNDFLPSQIPADTADVVSPESSMNSQAGGTEIGTDDRDST